MKGDFNIRPADETTFYWDINFVCVPLDRSGELFDVETHTLVGVGDTAAVTAGKIIDSAVAAIITRQPADDLPRTNIYLLDFIRGS